MYKGETTRRWASGSSANPKLTFTFHLSRRPVYGPPSLILITLPFAREIYF